MKLLVALISALLLTAMTVDAATLTVSPGRMVALGAVNDCAAVSLGDKQGASVSWPDNVFNGTLVPRISVDGVNFFDTTFVLPDGTTAASYIGDGDNVATARGITVPLVVRAAAICVTSATGGTIVATFMTSSSSFVSSGSDALSGTASANAPSHSEGAPAGPSFNLGGSQRVYVPDVGETTTGRITTAGENAISVTSVNTLVTGFDCENPSTTTAAYVFLYNKATAPAAGDNALKIGGTDGGWECGAAGGAGQRGGLVKDFVNGLGGFTAGLGFRITGSADSSLTTAAPAGVRFNIQYHQKAN